MHNFMKARALTSSGQLVDAVINRDNITAVAEIERPRSRSESFMRVMFIDGRHIDVVGNPIREFFGCEVRQENVAIGPPAIG